MRLVLEEADRVDGDVARLERREQVGVGHRAARVAAVGVDDEDLLARLVHRAAEVDADGVEERGPAIGLAPAQPRHQAAEVALAVGGDADFGVEVDDRHVLGARQAIEELDRGAARQLDVGGHAAAGVEDQADVQRRPLASIRPGVAAHEVADLLAAAGFGDLEVFELEIADRAARSCRGPRRRG